MRRTRIVIAGLAGALLVGVGSALAATIVGTSGNDMRGTPSADRLDGKAGNDASWPGRERSSPRRPGCGSP